MMKRFFRMAAAAALSLTVLAGCARKTTDVTEPAAEETTGEAATETAEPSSAEETTEAAQEQKYYMLQGVITSVESDGGAFTLQADDGSSYDIAMTDIRDAEVEVAPEAHVAIACIGEEGSDSSIMVVMLPEQEEWSILTVSGVTEANAMSSFMLAAEDGRRLSFLKDNCPVEEGALQNDSGDSITVTYVESQGTNFPIEITK